MLFSPIVLVIMRTVHSARNPGMANIEDILKRQKQGAKFVLSAPMLGMQFDEFDTVAKVWLSQGGPGFEAAGVPFRKVIDGEFLIARLTVVKTAAD